MPVVPRGQIGGSATLEDVSQREWVRPGGVGGLHGGTLTEPGVHVHGRATGGGFTGECPRAPLSPNPFPLGDILQRCAPSDLSSSDNWQLVLER